MKCKACVAKPAQFLAGIKAKQAYRDRMRQMKAAAKPVVQAAPVPANAPTVDALLAALRRYTGKTLVHSLAVQGGKVVAVMGSGRQEIVLCELDKANA